MITCYCKLSYTFVECDNFWLLDNLGGNNSRPANGSNVNISG